MDHMMGGGSGSDNSYIIICTHDILHILLLAVPQKASQNRVYIFKTISVNPKKYCSGRVARYRLFWDKQGPLQIDKNVAV
jgi:hypothetical protein